jgi:hypothetical protein
LGVCGVRDRPGDGRFADHTGGVGPVTLVWLVRRWRPGQGLLGQVNDVMTVMTECRLLGATIAVFAISQRWSGRAW